MAQSGIAAQHDTAVETLSFGFTAVTNDEAVPASILSSETISLTEIACGGRTFLFNHPLPVRVVQEGGGCSLESEEYNLLAYGHSRSEAESLFPFVFAACWDGVACKDDGFLTEKAIRMKRALRSLVKAQN